MMEGPVNRGDIEKGKAKLNHPWNQEPDFLSHDRARLKQEFLRPLDEHEVLEGFRNAKPVEHPGDQNDVLLELYAHQFGDFKYRVLDLKTKSGISKDLFFSLSRDPQQKPEAEFVFRVMDDPMGRKGYNFGHRIVRTQKEGISGSAFLKKAEEYIRILKKNDLVDCSWIALESIQPNVTEFFHENGYDFVLDGKSIHEKYKAHPERYETIGIDFTDDPLARDPAPVLKEAFADEEFMKYVTEENGVKTFHIDFRDAKKFEKYFPYVLLVKDL